MALAILPGDATWWVYIAAFGIFLGSKLLASYLLGLMWPAIGTERSPVVTLAKPKIQWGTVDHVYLTINHFVGFWGYSWALYWCWGTFPGSLNQVTFVNTFLAGCCILLGNDFMYFHFHRILHHPVLFRYIHLHHHLQRAPFRGVIDGENVHPLEEVGGLGLSLIAMFLTHCIMEVHAFAVLGFLACLTVGAMTNHLPFDARIPLLAGYTAADHHMHHVRCNCNYGNLTMLWDHLFGTYYPLPAASSAAGEKKA